MAAGRGIFQLLNRRSLSQSSVSANLKEKFSAAKEEVSAHFKGRFSAAKGVDEEIFGPRKAEFSGSSRTTADAKDGSNSIPGAESSQSQQSNDFKESSGEAESFFNKIKSTLSSAPKVSLAFQKLEEKVSGLASKGYDIIKDELSSSPSKRRRMQHPSNSTSEPRSTRTDIVVLPSKQTRLGEKWEAFKKKMHGHPLFKRVSGFSKPVVTMGQEIAEDVRERWETSDHPVVHKIQDLNETVFGETATALSFKEIRRRDPSFSLPDFVAEVQEMVRPVLTAYLKADVEVLKKYCSNEVIERCKAERTAYQSQGMFIDNKILHISEVDVRETKMMGSTPVIIVGFQTQQIYCVRDREGSITAGGKDTIHTIYYAWAMQQMDSEELGEGDFYPGWRLREMQQLGFQALI
ncbi:hypothetical protein J5N97_008170 [Dioscorea zingiberensis]|uniref:Tim44-like domain-containing protein n=1 Tax=Dioscorea zingiberensis TaxID=325984 RepID=A0A9D5DEX5_9LILI|nr:hypothetical protein J5N97_008170 [Dioscorea zingiberensis]